MPLAYAKHSGNLYFKVLSPLILPMNILMLSEMHDILLLKSNFPYSMMKPISHCTVLPHNINRVALNKGAFL